jgi:fatty acid desaturase
MAAPLYKRHKWSDGIKADVKMASVRDNYHWFLQVSENYLVIAMSVFLPYLFGGWVAGLTAPAWGLVVWIATYWIIAVPVIGCRQRALAELLHQSAHKTLAANPTLNFIAGTMFSGWLVAQSWSPYWISHVFRHHLRFGGSDDPDYQYHIAQGLYEPRSDGSFKWQFLISPLLFFRTPSKVVDLIRNRFISPEEPWWESVVKLTYLTLLVGTFVALGYGWEFFLFWVVPLLLSFPIVNWYVELTEHYPLVRGGSEDIHLSRNRWTGLIGKFLTGIHHENYHLVHHLFPGVPAWRLPQVHRILMRDPEYKAIQDREVGLVLPIIRGIPSILGGIVRSHPRPADSEDGQPARPATAERPIEPKAEAEPKAAHPTPAEPTGGTGTEPEHKS